MDQLHIVCIDDQPEVLNALEHDLSDFEAHTVVEVCDSGQEALELINELDQQGDHLALVISDQIMPGMTGVELLSRLQQDRRFSHAQKILLTGLATHQDTIEAINTGGIDHYIQKPWTKDDIGHAVKKGLTHFVTRAGLDYESYLPVLDQPLLYEILRNQS